MRNTNNETILPVQNGTTSTAECPKAHHGSLWRVGHWLKGFPSKVRSWGARRVEAIKDKLDQFLKELSTPYQWNYPRRFARHVIVELLWIGALALVTAGIEIGAPVYRTDLHSIILRPSVAGNFLPPDRFLYPYERLPRWLESRVLAVITTSTPMAIFAVFQLRFRSLWDLHAASMGVAKAVLTTSFVTGILKRSIGRYRPYFWEICQPDFHNPGARHDMSRFYMKHCQCDDKTLRRLLESFPSGHASCSFAAAMFLSLYLNAKLKTLSDHSTPIWIALITILPIIVVMVMSCMMVTLHQHHPQDIIGGWLLGGTLAIFTYRISYAAVFDFRYNHIPLPPKYLKTQFSHSEQANNMPWKSGEEDVDKLVAWRWWKHASTSIEQLTKEKKYLSSLQVFKKAPPKDGKKSEQKGEKPVVSGGTGTDGHDKEVRRRKITGSAPA